MITSFWRTKDVDLGEKLALKVNHSFSVIETEIMTRIIIWKGTVFQNITLV